MEFKEVQEQMTVAFNKGLVLQIDTLEWVKTMINAGSSNDSVLIFIDGAIDRVNEMVAEK